MMETALGNGTGNGNGNGKSQASPKRRTPIERYIEDGPAVDRRRKFDAEQLSLGFTRCTVRCHNDDCDKVRAYAAKLLAKRKPPGD